MTTVTDDFAGTGALGANWATNSGASVTDMDRSSDRLRATAGGVGIFNLWVANAFAGDQEAEIEIAVATASEWGIGPVVKGTSGTDNGYRVSFNNSRCFLQKLPAATIVIDVTSGITLSAGKVVRVTAETAGADLDLKLWLDGVQIGSTWTDTSPHTGTRIGLGSYAVDSTYRGDNFSGGDLSGGGTTPIAFSGTVPTLNGTVGASFSEDIGSYFDGTETPFAFTLQAGTLPAGLSLNSSTGVISGTPTTAGTSSGIVVRGTDATPDTDDSNSFSIVIAAAAATSLAVSVPDAAGVTGVNGVVLSAAAPGSGVTVIKTITAASFDGSGNMAIDITGLGATVGQYRYVILSKSDGTTSQSPAPFAAQGPVIAS